MGDSTRKSTRGTVPARRIDAPVFDAHRYLSRLPGYHDEHCLTSSRRHPARPVSRQFQSPFPGSPNGQPSRGTARADEQPVAPGEKRALKRVRSYHLPATYQGERPPPPRRGRSVLGRASLTVIERPPISARFSSLMAVAASLLSAISTKANPRGRPVSRSLMMLTMLTHRVGGQNVGSRSSSVVVSAKLPT